MWQILLTSLDFWSAYILLFYSTILGLTFPFLLTGNSNAVLWNIVIVASAVLLFGLRIAVRRFFPLFVSRHAVDISTGKFSYLLISASLIFYLTGRMPDLIQNSIAGLTGWGTVLCFAGLIPVFCASTFFHKSLISPGNQYVHSPKGSLPLLLLMGFPVIFILKIAGLDTDIINPRNGIVITIGRLVTYSFPLFLIRLLLFGKNLRG